MKCYCCSEKAVQEEHHLIPQSRGGKDLWKVFLCVKHHKEAHYLAKSKKPLESIENVKLRKIVQILKLAETMPHAPFYKVNMNLPIELYNRIRFDAKANKTSIPKIIVAILAAHYGGRK